MGPSQPGPQPDALSLASADRFPGSPFYLAHRIPLENRSHTLEPEGVLHPHGTRCWWSVPWASCPTAEPSSFLPQLKRRTVAGSVCARDGQGGLLDPGPEAWQVEESSTWTPGGVPGRCVEKMLILHPRGGAENTLVFDKLVDVVLGPMLAGGDFEHKSNDEQGLLGVSACDHLGDR